MSTHGAMIPLLIGMLAGLIGDTRTWSLRTALIVGSSSVLLLAALIIFRS